MLIMIGKKEFQIKPLTLGNHPETAEGLREIADSGKDMRKAREGFVKFFTATLEGCTEKDVMGFTTQQSADAVTEISKVFFGESKAKEGPESPKVLKS